MRCDATCSFAASDSGANIGTRSISSSSGAGATDRSSSTSRRYATSASSGRIEPTTANAARGPTIHDDRRRDRAERDTAHRETPDESEHPRQRLVRDDPLQEREHRDVLEAVRGADDREQQTPRRGTAAAR